MKSYRVVYELDESGHWIARIPRINGCHSYGRSINEARDRIREALGLFVAGADRARLVDDVQLPAEARAVVAELRAARAHSEQAEEAERAARKAAVRKLTRALRLSTRDTAELVGLSHQRVQQLAHERPAGSGRRRRLTAGGTSG